MPFFAIFLGMQLLSFGRFFEILCSDLRAAQTYWPTQTEGTGTMCIFIGQIWTWSTIHKPRVHPHYSFSSVVVHQTVCLQLWSKLSVTCCPSTSVVYGFYFQEFCGNSCWHFTNPNFLCKLSKGFSRIMLKPSTSYESCFSLVTQHFDSICFLK